MKRSEKEQKKSLAIFVRLQAAKATSRSINISDLHCTVHCTYATNNAKKYMQCNAPSARELSCRGACERGVFWCGEGEGERDLNGGKLEKEKRSMGSRMTCMRLTVRERDGKKRADPTAHNA